MIASIATPVPDVPALRREVYAGGAVVTREELSRLLEMAGSLGDSCTHEFDDFIAEVATDLLVHQADPPLYVSAADTDWLIQTLEESSPPAGTRQRLLVEVLRRAVRVPARLATFAVGVFERAIVEGPKLVTAADVEALRVAVFAATDASALHVTRQSADALFRIDRATQGTENDPTFVEFFAKAVGDHLLGIAFHWTPDAAEEIRKEEWLDAPPPGLGRFLGSMFGASGHSLDAGTFESPIEAEEALARRQNEADARERTNAQTIDSEKAAWILAKFGSSEAPTPAERALLSFLGREASSMPAEIRALIDRQAARRE
jgi:hypothetical protein